MLRTALQALGTSLQWKVHPAFTLSLFRTVKTTTGIVGLPVDPEARLHLKEKLELILDTIKIIPADVEYRKVVEETVNRRLELVNNTELTDEQVEVTYGAQLEQQIKQCEDELGLIPKMAEWKPWDGPELAEEIEEKDLEESIRTTKWI